MELWTECLPVEIIRVDDAVIHCDPLKDVNPGERVLPGPDGHPVVDPIPGRQKLNRGNVLTTSGVMFSQAMLLSLVTEHTVIHGVVGATA